MAKRDIILQRSTQIFLDRGFNKISVDEIAQEIGISKKTIYNNFGSKDNLLKEIIESAVAAVVTRTKGILLGEKSIIDKINGTFENIYNFHSTFEKSLKKDPNAFHIMNGPLCVALDSEMNDAIYKIGKEAKEKGYIREGVNIEMFPYIFNNIISSTATWGRPDNVSFLKMDLMKQTIQLVIDGILTPEAQKLLNNK